MTNQATVQMLCAESKEVLVGQAFCQFITTAYQTHCQESLHKLLATRERFLCLEVALQRMGGDVIPVEIHAGFVCWQGHDAVQVVMHNMAQCQEVNQKLQQAHRSAAERAARFRLLVEMGRDLISTRDLHALLHLALQRATRFGGYDGGSILLLNGKDGALEVCASWGADAVEPGTRVDDLAHSVSGRVMQEQRPLILEEHGEDAGTGWRTYTKSIPSTVNLPLIAANGQSIGVLCLKSTKEPRRLSADDFDALQLLASQLAVTVENSQLHEELAQREYTLLDLVERLMTSQEEERRRVAYELHDGLAQVAVSAYQHLQTFASHYRPRSERSRHEFNQALELAQRVVKETRQVIAGLRPTVLDDFGLESALRHEVNNLRAEGWEVTYHETLSPSRLPPTFETAFFRVAQEALNNIRKHAGKTSVCLTMLVQEKTIRLEVQDWGYGFEPSESEKQSSTGEQVGLVSMQERMALLGGMCRIESQPGKGTLVIAEAPRPDLREEQPSDE